MTHVGDRTTLSQSLAIGVGTAAVLLGGDAGSTREVFIAALLHEGKLHGFATRLRNRRGLIMHVEVSATTTRINEEKVLVAIVRDVTERKKLKMNLQNTASILSK
jgi:PAS domain S-box-containing protein